MIALIAVRRSTANISSAIASSEPWTISSVKGSSAVEAVDLARAGGVAEAVADVLPHPRRVAAPRVAVAAAPAGVDADHVVAVHGQRRHDRVLLDAAVRAQHLGPVRGALGAALLRPRPVPVPRVRAREEAAVGAHAVV